jgi:hypothetical protein
VILRTRNVSVLTSVRDNYFVTRSTIVARPLINVVIDELHFLKLLVHALCEKNNAPMAADGPH